MDLHHFARGAARATDRESPPHDIYAIIDGDGARRPIIATGHVGGGIAPARALSIYFPAAPAVVRYDALDLA